MMRGVRISRFTETKINKRRDEGDGVKARTGKVGGVEGRKRK
jgi:hypothetical protein